MPFPTSFHSSRLFSLPLPQPRIRISTAVRILSMADQTQSDSAETHLPVDPNASPNYPVPISPPWPQISKHIELSRAMTASSKSGLFSISRSEFLFEDDWLIAVNKPQGVYCESVLSSVQGLLSDSSQLGDQDKLPELHLANRLDRDTSGIMVITKAHKVAAKLVKAFTDHKIKKTYIAFCIGPAPRWERITVKSGHGRSKFGAWRVYAASDVGRKLPGGSAVREMETSFEVLLINGQERSNELPELEKCGKVIVVEEKSVAGDNTKRDEVLVRAYPQSGRTHQIRLHCQYLGIPIRGDVRYDGVIEWNEREYDGHELHAESLSFEHPVSGLPVVLKAPLPLWASEAIKPLSDNHSEI